jgi:hypothetical protein
MAHDRNDAAELAEVPPTAYRHDNALARARVWLPLAVLTLAGAFWAAEFFARGDGRYSPGPLAGVHATWDDNCAACHVGSRPLAGNNWAAALTGQTHVADAQCQTCHAGPPHHAGEKPNEAAGCTTCHREHHGRQAALTRVADSHCTRCHADLASHVQAGGQTHFEDVSGFGDEHHPEFRAFVEKKDPGTVAFNHKLHLSLGMARQPGGVAILNLGQIPEAFRARYRPPGKVDPNSAVQLKCASCHHTDGSALDGKREHLAGLPQNAVLPARGSGAYMQPILYEEHCQACHPITIKRAAKDRTVVGDVTVRHRVQPAELEEVLRGHYITQFLGGKLAVSPALLKTPLPGKDPRREEEQKAAEALIAKSVDADMAILLGTSTCQKCHPSLGRDRTHVEPAKIPQVWFKHAKFDHTAHRAITCLECHAGAPESQMSSDVLLPGIQTCLKCHAPAGHVGAAPVGGARFDCVECHRFHGGDDPLHGKGAAARQPAGGATFRIESFLSDPDR